MDLAPSSMADWVSAIGTVLALLGAGLAIRLQARELKLQRLELAEQRKELREQRREFEGQRQELALSVAAQNRIAEINQQFEFMNFQTRLSELAITDLDLLKSTGAFALLGDVGAKAHVYKNLWGSLLARGFQVGLLTEEMLAVELRAEVFSTQSGLEWWARSRENWGALDPEPSDFVRIADAEYTRAIELREV